MYLQQNSCYKKKINVAPKFSQCHSLLLQEPSSTFHMSIMRMNILCIINYNTKKRPTSYNSFWVHDVGHYYYGEFHQCRGCYYSFILYYLSLSNIYFVSIYYVQQNLEYQKKADIAHSKGAWCRPLQRLRIGLKKSSTPVQICTWWMVIAIHHCCMMRKYCRVCHGAGVHRDALGPQRWHRSGIRVGVHAGAQSYFSSITWLAFMYCKIKC